MIFHDTVLRDLAKIVAWYPLRWGVAAAPWRVAYFLGEAVGYADSLISSRRMDSISRNVLAACGDRVTQAEARRIARRNIQRHYIEHMEFYKYGRLNPANLSRHIRFEGLGHLEAALAAGRGAILVHMHYGCKQFPLVSLGLLGYDVSQIGYRDDKAAHHSWMHNHVHLRVRMRLESRFPVKHVHVGASMRPAYETLRRNGILMISGDGVGGSRGAGENYLPLPFLGRTMLFPPGPARMARTTGAALLPLFCVQQPDYTHTAIIEAPVRIRLTADRDSDVRETTAEFVRVFATYVTRHPEHWMFWEEFHEGCLIPKPEAPAGESVR